MVKKHSRGMELPDFQSLGVLRLWRLLRFSFQVRVKFVSRAVGAVYVLLVWGSHILMQLTHKPGKAGCAQIPKPTFVILVLSFHELSRKSL